MDKIIILSFITAQVLSGVFSIVSMIVLIPTVIILLAIIYHIVRNIHKSQRS
jgi:hypothetical protein